MKKIIMTLMMMVLLATWLGASENNANVILLQTEEKLKLKPVSIKTDEIPNYKSSEWKNSDIAKQGVKYPYARWLIETTPHEIYKEGIVEEGRIKDKNIFFRIRAGYFSDKDEAGKVLMHEIATPTLKYIFHIPYKEGSFTGEKIGDVSYFREVKYFGDVILFHDVPTGSAPFDTADLIFKEGNFVVHIRETSDPGELNVKQLEELALKVKEKIITQLK